MAYHSRYLDYLYATEGGVKRAVGLSLTPRSLLHAVRSCSVPFCDVMLVYDCLFQCMHGYVSVTLPSFHGVMLRG